MPDTKKLLLVGWDAADWKIIDPLMAAGHLPNLRRLVDGGVRGNLTTLQPVLSPMLWTSIATGKRPHKHGIYGFTEPTPDETGIQPMTNLSRRCRALWNIATLEGMTSNVVTWWPSHPAEPIDGAMVSDSFHTSPRHSDQVWDLAATAIHPRRLYEPLRDLRVHPRELTPEHVLPFVPDAKDVDQSSDPRLSVCMRMIAEATSVHAAVTHLMEHEPWDLTAVYYDAIDHFSHGFMKFRPPKQPHVSDHEFHLYRHVVNTAYVYHDMMLGRLLELSGDETIVVLVSDHGFQSDHLRPSRLPAEPAGPAHEHREQGILVVAGPGVRRGATVEGATLLDVTPTILHLLGRPVGEDMDGRALEELLESPRPVRTIPSWDEVDGHDGSHPPDRAVDPDEAKAALEQLVALGYIDRPPEDARAAIRQTTRELEYNLARAYMDAGLFGEAIPLLAGLYREAPLEFRFGVQLANCLRAMQRDEDLGRLVDDLEARWRVASEQARGRLRDIARIARERRAQWRALRKLDEEHAGDPSRPRLARMTAAGRPMIFTENEAHVIRKIRAIARGNPRTLDFLSAVVASAREEHARAAELVRDRGLDTVDDPSMLAHVGTMLLEAGDAAEARRVLERALELDPLHPNALLGLGRVALAEDDAGRTRELVGRALALRPVYPGAYLFLGRALEALGDPAGAADAYRTGIAQNPNFPEAHERLARVVRELDGDEDEARSHHRAGMDLRLEQARTAREAPPLALPETSVEEVLAALPDLPPDPTADGGGFVRCLAQAPVVRPAAAGTASGDGVATGNGAADGGGGGPAGSDGPPVVIVSGLPRSGTSMMMQMLAAGGLEPHADGERTADENNPKGYYEAESVKRLANRNEWIGECGGRCLKVVAPLLPYLPQDVAYRIVFMDRALEEVVGSQTRMLERLDRGGARLEDERLAAMFRQQLDVAFGLLRLHGVPVLRVPYAGVVEDPAGTAARVAEFVGGSLDVAAMAAAVDPSLYRERATPS